MPLSRSGAPEQDKGAVVGAADLPLHGRDQSGRAGAETAGQHAFGLAEQPVGAHVDVPAGRFDQAIGVEHERVTALQHAVLGLGGRAVQRWHERVAWLLAASMLAAAAGTVLLLLDIPLAVRMVGSAFAVASAHVEWVLGETRNLPGPHVITERDDRTDERIALPLDRLLPRGEFVPNDLELDAARRGLQSHRLRALLEV